jgi:hypothetical protein
VVKDFPHDSNLSDFVPMRKSTSKNEGIHMASRMNPGTANSILYSVEGLFVEKKAVEFVAVPRTLFTIISVQIMFLMLAYPRIGSCSTMDWYFLYIA